MITISKQPEQIALAENEVWINGYTNNLYSNAGSYASCQIDFTAAPSIGQKFTFNFDGNAYEFTVAFTVISILQIPMKLITEAQEEWVDRVAIYLQRNLFISAYFYIQRSPDFIIQFAAKQKGSAYNCNITNITITGATESYTGGMDVVIRDNFKIVLQIADLNKEVIHTELLDVDENGVFTADISELLQPYLTDGFTYPWTYSGMMIPYSDICKLFYFQLAEHYAGQTYLFTNYAAFHAIKGGITKQLRKSWDENAIDFYSYLQTNKKYLNFNPDGFKLFPNHQSRLYFIVPEGVTSVYINLVTYTQQGTIDEEVGQETISVNPYDVVEINSSNLNYIPASDYGLNIMNADTDEYICKTYKFIYNSESKYYTKYIAYRNSLGVYDIFAFTGKSQLDAEYEKRQLQQGADAYSLQQSITDKAYETETLSINSGWISLEMMNALRQINLSTQVYLLENMQKIPYIVTSKKAPLKKDGEFLYSIGFELQLAYNNQHYSK